MLGKESHRFHFDQVFCESVIDKSYEHVFFSTMSLFFFIEIIVFFLFLSFLDKVFIIEQMLKLLDIDIL